MNKLLLLSVILSLGMCGCGGTSGATTDLNTVILTVTPSSFTRLEADVLTGNSCPLVDGTYTTETIPITVTSTPYPNAVDKSPVTISSIAISYSKYEDAPSIPPVQYDTGLVINPGALKTFDVNVATDKLKFDLVDKYGLNLCSSDYWEYYVTITFNGVEDHTGKSFSFSTVVKVAFADRS